MPEDVKNDSVEKIVSDAIEDVTDIRTPELKEAAKRVDEALAEKDAEGDQEMYGKDTYDEAAEEVKTDSETEDKEAEGTDEDKEQDSMQALIDGYDEAVNKNHELEEKLTNLVADHEKMKAEREVLLKRLGMGFRQSFNTPVKELQDAKSQQDAEIDSVIERITKG